MSYWSKCDRCPAQFNDRSQAEAHRCPPECSRCEDSGTVEVGKGTLRPHLRGCPDCPRGAEFERSLARADAAQRERDLDATGQDQESYDEQHPEA